MKIKSKILTTLLLFGVIVLFFTIAVSYLLAQSSLKNETIDKLKTSAQLKASHIDTYINWNLEKLDIILEDPELIECLENCVVQTVENAKLNTYLANAQKKVDTFKTVSILNTEGAVIGSTNPDEIGRGYANTTFFTSGRKEKSFSLDLDPTKEEDKYYLSAPILDSEGNLLAVLVIDSDTADLFEITTDTAGLGNTGEIYLLNEQTQIISPPQVSGDIYLGLFVEGSTSFTCQAEGYGITGASTMFGRPYKSYRGVDVYGASYPISEVPWCMIVEIESNEVVQPANELLSTLTIIAGITVVSIFALSSILGGIISRPILTLHEESKKIEGGDFNHKVATESSDEIGDLSRTMDKMTEAVLESQRNIQQKVDDQTVEIRTQKDSLERLLDEVNKEKEKSEELAEDLRKFKQAVDNASDQIVITDNDGTILYVNSSIEKTTGFSVDEVLGRKAGSNNLWGGNMDKKFYQNMWDAIKVRKLTFHGDVKNTKKNGEEYDADLSITPILDDRDEVKFFLGIERDVSHERAVDRAKSEFVSLASHELRTPLSAINWYSEMLYSGDVGEINDDQKSYLGEVKHAVERMVALVNSLLNVSRLEMGTLRIDPEKVKITDLAEKVIKELLPRMGEKKLEFHRNYDEIEEMDLDPKLVEVIFQNLLSNAIKYTPDKGSVELSIESMDNDVLIKVTDNGYGIPKEQQERIFTKLFRADNVVEKDTEGTGLGLYVVKSILDSANGKIWFESEQDKGTTFYVSLPKIGMKKKMGTKSLNKNLE